MLEKYFVRPCTVDRVRASWIGAEIERYVESLDGQGYSWKSVVRRVPLLVEFGEFGRAHGASVVGDLPVHVDAFIAERRRLSRRRDAYFVKEVRGPVEQMLRLAIPGFVGHGRPHRPEPFADALPGFYEYLAAERGVASATIGAYQHHLVRFEAYLERIGVVCLSELSPAILTAFVVERAALGLGKATVRDGCGVLRVFLRYAHREGVIASDLSAVMDRPQFYRLSTIPRSITWEEVGRVLAGVDRRTPAGRRDWAILLLLVTYGLRGREVTALTLDDIAIGSVSGSRCRSARPGTRPRSRSRRRSGRRWWTICATVVRRPRAGGCSSGRSRRWRRSPRRPSQPARGITSSRPGSKLHASGRTRSDTHACSGSSTPTSR